MAHVGPSTVAIVGQSVDQDRDATRAVALVEDCLDRVGLTALARAFGDRALDVVLRHRRRLGLGDRERQRRVAGRVTAAVTRRHGHGARELCELLSAPRVDDRLLVLDRSPLGMS